MRRAVAALAAVMMLMGCSGQRAEKLNREGNERLQKGDPRGAVAAFADAVSLQPNVPKYHFNLGLAYARMGHLDAASAQFSETLRLDPADVEASRYLTLTNGAIAERAIRY